MVSDSRNNWLRNTLDHEVYECVEYLDLHKEGPNRGTKNKQELMIRTLEYLHNWNEGIYNDWIRKLANRLSVTPRTVRDNYLDPIISEGIVGRVGHKVHFNGVPKSDSSEDS